MTSLDRLSMTCIAIRQFFDVIVLNESLALLHLIRRPAPADVKDFRAGTDKRFGLPMAFEAPFHLQGRLAPRQRHVPHRAVAGRAADAFGHMDAVIEINVIRKYIDADPSDGFARAIRFADGLEHRALIQDLGMAGHAGFDGRNPRER